MNKKVTPEIRKKIRSRNEKVDHLLMETPRRQMLSRSLGQRAEGTMALQ